jgi:diketogulonate reductase-like aldo/keto reductase
VLEACRELDVALIAYCPLARGQIPQGGTSLNQTLAAVAHARRKTVSQVALNWLLNKDERVIAIPGATSVAHVRENVGAVGWTLTNEEFAALERFSP